MTMQTPEGLLRKRDQKLKEHFDGVKDVQEKLRDLVAHPGYPYLKAMGRTILEKYACQPPSGPLEEQAKWETYTRMKWAIDKLFLDVDSLAATTIPNQDKVPDATNRRNQFNTRAPGSSSRTADRKRR